MYVKLYPALWDGSMAADPFDVWALFLFLCAHADREGFVELTPEVIARRSGIPLDLVEAGIARLEAPDPRSRSREHDGRRLEPIDDRGWGWRIVNYTRYRDLKDEDQRREQNRQAQARRRERLRQQASADGQHQSAPVSTSQHESAAVSPSDADADASQNTCPPHGGREPGSPSATNGKAPTNGASEPDRPPEPGGVAEVGRRRRDGEPNGFGEFYAAYPRHDGRRAAAQEFARALKRNPTYTPADLKAAAVEFGKQIENEGREARFIPLPRTWLSQDRFREFFNEDEDHAQAQVGNA